MYHLSSESLKKVSETVVTLIGKIEDDDRRAAVERLFNELGERYLTAPASGREQYHNAFPGGLAEHSLRVYAYLKKLCKDYLKDDNITNDSLIIVALFHDLGKIGNLDTDYYIEEESNWHREKLGQIYKFNPEYSYMPHSQMSLFLLSKFGVDLSEDEYRAILTHDGQYVDENSPYSTPESEGIFSFLCQTADRLALYHEKNRWLKWVEEND